MAASETTSVVEGSGSRLILKLLGVALAYFALAKLGLLLAQVHPNATPIWPPAGFALAVLLLWGNRLWPAIFIGALAANAATAGSAFTSTGIAIGNTLEALSAFWLLHRYSGGSRTFETPLGVARFAAISVFVAAPISATIGVTTLILGGYSTLQAFPSVWATWWLGNVAGVLVLCPAIVLWVEIVQSRGFLARPAESCAAVLTAAVVGILAFSPLVGQTTYRGSIAFLAVVPLLWSSLRLGPAVTAAASVVLAAFAIWGTVAGSGPFATGSLNEDLLNLLSFMVSTSVPSLALSAELLRQMRHTKVLDDTLHERTDALNTATDILRKQSSERARTQQQLLNQAIHLREAQRLANLGSWSWELAGNRVSWSDQLFVIYGIAKSEFDGSLEGYLARIHPDDRNRTRRIIEQTLAGGNSFQTEERILRPDGQVRFLRTSGEVLRDASGAPIRMLGICADVTEERDAASRLASAQEQLVHFQKLEALGKLTGGVAHDFNNLLMIIGASAESLRKHISDQTLTGKLDAIKTATDRGSTLTRQLLTFSRQQLLNPVAVDLAARLPELTDMLKSSLRGNIVLEIDCPAGLWRVRADPAQLELCIVNFAVNARDAMPDGGIFRITAKHATLEGETAKLSGEFVALTFEDNGIGIPREQQPKVFDPFFTTKPSGTGLGLSQVYGFALASGGAVSMTSEPGRTAFTLYLPRTLDPLPADEEAERRPLPADAAGRALVVDDNTEVANITAEMLRGLGYEVETSSGGDAALEALQAGLTCDLVVTDVVMPGRMDGIALANCLRTSHPDLPVVVVTGYLQSVSQPLGRLAVVQKPFTPADLYQAIKLAELKRSQVAAK